MLEQALVLSLLKRDPLSDPAQELAALEKMTRALPTQSVRSEDQVNFQQFSTPASGFTILCKNASSRLLESRCSRRFC